MIITAVYDKKLESFLPQSVSASENVLVAVRNYKGMLRNTFMVENIDDFSIYSLCTIGSESGEVLDSSKSFVCELSDLFTKPVSEE